jgi:radical SAM superfamily enzyme YgiQ (UPF0313 family)
MTTSAEDIGGMKIKLIAPHEQSETNISSAETFKIQKLCLPLLAALTPANHEVKIVDESFAPYDAFEDVDLVGISVLTDLVLRAYYLADEYRKRGAKVVLGGIHPTVLPDEALEHADAIVVGEAEQVWPQLVSDASSGRLAKVYRAQGLTNLRDIPHARRDLYPNPIKKGYTPVAHTLETSRGCVYDCEFCSISQVMGHRCRVRPVSDVIAEIESVDSSNLFFVDDSLGLQRSFSKKFFKEMIPLKRVWVGQGTASLAEDIESLRLMKRSGCIGLLIGFESVQEAAQNEMSKLKNMSIDFSEAMHRFHNEGIAILGAFVFGFDHEDKDVFDQTLEFVMKHRVDYLQLRILVPFPGTRLYERLLKEDRLFAPKWWLDGYSTETLLFRPKGMSPDDLLDGFTRLNRQTYSYRAIVKRFFGMSPWKRTALGCQIYGGYNIATRKRYFQGLGTPQPFVDL